IGVAERTDNASDPPKAWQRQGQAKSALGDVPGRKRKRLPKRCIERRGRRDVRGRPRHMTSAKSQFAREMAGNDLDATIVAFVVSSPKQDPHVVPQSPFMGAMH